MPTKHTEDLVTSLRCSWASTVLGFKSRPSRMCGRPRWRAENLRVGKPCLTSMPRLRLVTFNSRIAPAHPHPWHSLARKIRRILRHIAGLLTKLAGFLPARNTSVRSGPGTSTHLTTCGSMPAKTRCLRHHNRRLGLINLRLRHAASRAIPSSRREPSCSSVADVGENEFSYVELDVAGGSFPLVNLHLHFSSRRALALAALISRLAEEKLASAPRAGAGGRCAPSRLRAIFCDHPSRGTRASAHATLASLLSHTFRSGDYASPQNGRPFPSPTRTNGSAHASTTFFCLPVWRGGPLLKWCVPSLRSPPVSGGFWSSKLMLLG